MLELGKKIKELRKNKNYSARELSERSGVARSLISQLETGKRQSTSMDTVYRLAKALDVTLSYLFTEEPSADFPSAYRQANDSSHFSLNEKSLPYLDTLQRAQKAGLSPELLNELIDLILRIRLENK
ncbi:helix-turn-helix transcriptional regulator [Desulfitobacterium sp.]|uniref:helix-turn-helix domain-containing protein n=1 Tax=Desulfitobacterium sp. TaxID=49981 RepID=UPI002B791AC9|nr:helix-turn-helix transcriptional regulator [Desulfitobacterium sp.]HVJ50328.1 helix-turn-helix transcriptional regulator [Desulfitobacterium sp.]